MIKYQATWQRFAKGDHVSQAVTPGDGTIGFALVVPVRDVGVVERVIEIQREVAQVVTFTPIPRDSLHITVTVLSELQVEWQPGGSLVVDRSLLLSNTRARH